MKYFLSFNFEKEKEFGNFGYGNSFLNTEEEIKTEEDVAQVQEFLKKEVEKKEKCVLKNFCLMSFIKIEE